MPHAVEFGPGRIQAQRGIIQNVAKIWIVARRPSVALSVAAQYHWEPAFAVSRKLAIPCERLFAQIWGGYRKRDRNTSDRNMERTQAILRAGLRSQVSITPLLHSATPASGARSAFRSKRCAKSPTVTERKLL